MKRRKGHTRQILLLFLSIEILAVAGLLAYIQMRPMVVEAVTLEAGTDMPDVEEFLLYKNRKGSFLTDMQTLDLKDPGTYEIKIKVGNRIQTSNLQVIDTTPPTATISDQLVLRDEEIKADAFVTNIVDATNVTVTYQEIPDTSTPGEKEASLILEDSCSNRTILKAKLTVLDIKNTVTIEAGSAMDITADDFAYNDEYDISFITDLATLDISKPIIHKILIDVNGKEITVNIEVVDTTAPKATFINKMIWKDEALEAIAFVTNILDVSDVTAEYKTPPDTSKIGNQEIVIVLKDDYGNYTEQPVILTVIEDVIPPQIIGTRNKTVYVGDGVAYRKGVYVTDNRDTDLEVTVDSSEVNLKNVGTYNVIYSAEDTAGNKSTITTTVTVIKFTVSQDIVNEQADKVLNKIITADMTKLEKAKAIYHWIKTNVGYAGDSDKTDWLAEAYRGLKEGKGDCFTYYAVAQAMLTRAGIDSMQVTRLGGRTQHFWNLVDCGDGWYHFDSCPNTDHVETFMLTDKELDDFAAIRGSYYYNRDKTLYPATPEE